MRQSISSAVPSLQLPSRSVVAQLRGVSRDANDETVLNALLARSCRRHDPDALERVVGDDQGLTVDMEKGLLCKLSYINRISMPVYRGRTPLTRQQIEVIGTLNRHLFNSLCSVPNRTGCRRNVNVTRVTTFVFSSEEGDSLCFVLFLLKVESPTVWSSRNAYFVDEGATGNEMQSPIMSRAYASPTNVVFYTPASAAAIIPAQAEYGTYPFMVAPEYRSKVLKPLNDRFCLAEACLLADVVQYLQEEAGRKAFHPRCGKKSLHSTWPNQVWGGTVTLMDDGRIRGRVPCAAS